MQTFIDEQAAEGKRSVLLFAHDNDRPISDFLHGSPIVFRYSMSKRFSYRDEYSIPFGVGKFRETAQQATALPWSRRPKVTFMGWATPFNPNLFVNPNEKALEVKGLVSPEVFKTPANLGVVLRKKALNYLSDDSRIDTDFKINSVFFLHHMHEEQEWKYQEYIRLIRETHYVLALRGCGNYSIRLFETMAAGRIPIMVDTNQYLPFEDEIAWKELGIWIPIDKFGSISDLVVDYHDRGGQVGYQERIQNIGDIYSKFLSRDASLNMIEKIIEGYL